MTLTWQNWSGNVQSQPVEIFSPNSEEETQAIIQRAIVEKQIVRVVGTAHSFSPIVASNGFIISLDNLSGVGRGGLNTHRAVVQAGTKIHDMGEPLRALGLALPNQGDIDRQALAGALSTGTHGTGPNYGNLSTRIVGLRLINGLGEIVTITETDEELLRAARVSVGTFGVVLSYVLELVPAFRLHEKQWRATVKDCFNEIEDLIASNDHFEFFWRPDSDLCEMKSLNETDAAPDPMKRGDDANADDPLASNTGEYVDHSYLVFPSDRDVKFNECEYSIPAEHGPECFHAIRRLMQKEFPAVMWPVEYRTQAADDSFISAASRRETVAISIHEGAENPYQEFFQAAEQIFARYDGRPHWGKYHSLDRQRIQALYPDWDRFQACRRQIDPNGLFLNDHLTAIFAD